MLRFRDEKQIGLPKLPFPDAFSVFIFPLIRKSIRTVLPGGVSDHKFRLDHLHPRRDSPPRSRIAGEFGSVLWAFFLRGITRRAMSSRTMYDRTMYDRAMYGLYRLSLIHI